MIVLVAPGLFWNSGLNVFFEYGYTGHALDQI